MNYAFWGTSELVNELGNRDSLLALQTKPNLLDPAEVLRRSELEDKLLNIVENASEFTQSDLQGVIGAFVISNCPLPIKQQKWGVWTK